MALLYMRASSNCLLEGAGFVEAVDCCIEENSHGQGAESPSGEYGCCPIEYAVYSSFDSGLTELVIPPLDLAFLSAVLPPQVPVEISAVQQERPPPDLPKSWQFVFRTALPPRAPSPNS